MMPAALDIIYRIIQNFSRVDNSPFKRSATLGLNCPVLLRLLQTFDCILHSFVGKKADEEIKITSPGLVVVGKC